jgi:hypothetical protein
VDTRPVQIMRRSLVSKRPFDKVMESLDAALGHPDIGTFSRKIAAVATSEELERVVNDAVGSSGLMEFMRLNIGAVLRLYHGARSGQSLRLLVGNPVTMKRMAEHVSDAASYAPVTLLIDERADGIHLSYDAMASFLAPYANEEALQVARELDAKIETLLTEACG